MEGLIGRKLGMTQVFGEDGRQIPVTVLALGPGVVVQRKTEEIDGYDAVQIGYDEQRPIRVTKPLLGHFRKAEVPPQKVLCEITVPKDSELKAGDAIHVSSFEGVAFVDVVGVTKGRGFQGVVRRHGMRGQPGSHGSSTHRRVGSIGQCEFPARVFRGRRLPGQMGNVRCTTQNLKVVAVRGEDNVLLVRGAVPGPTGGVVVVRRALKKGALAAS